MEKITRQEAEDKERAVKATLDGMKRDFNQKPLSDDEIELVEGMVQGKLHGKNKVNAPD